MPTDFSRRRYRTSAAIAWAIASLGAIPWGVLNASSARASIRLENRDLFVRFEDLVISTSGQDLPLERVYNSKSPYDGWFGPGWGSTLEVRLLPQADGSIIAQEFGGGAEIRFEPAGADRQTLLQSAIQQLARWAATRGTFGSAAQREAYVSRLREDARYREAQLAQAMASGKLQLPAFAPGRQFVAARFQYQYITRTKDGYVRRKEDGSSEVFGLDGKLRALQRGTVAWTVQYDARGRISQLADAMGKVTRFRFNASGLLERVDSTPSSVVYTYDTHRQLVSAIRSGGAPGSPAVKFQYAYDATGRHLLLEAVYPDGSKIEARYEDLVHQEDLKYFRDRNGMSTEVRSLGDSASGAGDPLHRGYEVIETTPDGHPSKTEYEYFARVKPNGEQWTFRKIETLGDERTETVFNECCGKPIEITSSSVTTGKLLRKSELTYDGYGRLISKSSSAAGTAPNVAPEMATEAERYVYNGASDRLTRFEKSGSKGTYAVIFIYDTQGRLIGAKQSKGPSFMLFYDAAGRLARVSPSDSAQPIDVAFTEQPRQTLLTSQALGKWTLPDRGAKASPQQKSLLDSWNRLLDLYHLSNNPLPN